jgi:predicted DNA-binding WGR domain protein
VANPEVSTGRYERLDEESSHHEFWIGEVRGRIVTIQFGSVGTTGHRGSREFKTPEAAREFLKARLDQKINEGYKQV